MHKIRHIAIRADDQAKVAEFYKSTFGMKEVRNDADGRAMYLSDGYITLAILRSRPGMANGIDHFGFQVDDLADIESKLRKFDEPMTARPSTRPYAEHRAMDPDGNLFDISVHGYDDIEYAADREKQKVSEKVPS